MNRSEKKKLERLINTSLNQSLTEEQERELSKLLADDEEAQALYQQLRTLDRDLNDLSTSDSGVDVSDEVMEKVNSFGDSKAGNYHKPTTPHQGFHFTHTARYLAAAVAGILIGVGSMMISQRGDLDMDQLQGTMIAGQKMDGISYKDGETQIRLIPYLQEDAFYLNFFTLAPEEVEFTISFDAEDYKPLTGDYSSLQARHADYLNGQIHFSVLNQASYQFVLKKQKANPAPVEVKAMKNNKIIIIKKITP